MIRTGWTVQYLIKDSGHWDTWIPLPTVYMNQHQASIARQKYIDSKELDETEVKIFSVDVIENDQLVYKKLTKVTANLEKNNLSSNPYADGTEAIGLNWLNKISICGGD
jgi:hypothetical protein